MKLAKRIAAMLPNGWQHEMKRVHFRRQIKNGKFYTDEPEFKLLGELVTNGDWVVDVGANIGHYTRRLSELVGINGRVIAFEPIPETFSILAENVRGIDCNNVTLINVALSSTTEVVGFDIPKSDTGLQNYYQAHVTQSEISDVRALTLRLDSLQLENRISLVKIDAEGHESSVLEGMHDLLSRDKPTLIVETSSQEIQDMLAVLGYKSEVLDGSPNILFRFDSNV